MKLFSADKRPIGSECMVRVTRVRCLIIGHYYGGEGIFRYEVESVDSNNNSFTRWAAEVQLMDKEKTP